MHSMEAIAKNVLCLSKLLTRIGLDGFMASHKGMIHMRGDECIFELD